MKNMMRPALSLFVLLTAITGIAYPMLVTAIAQIAFPEAAHGSLVVRDGRVVGSSLIGQSFASTKYFWGRLSATTPMAYNGGSSSGSNLGPSNPALAEAAKARIAALHAADPGNTATIPVDLVTASGSGLDPQISVAAAEYQVARVAHARGMTPEQVRTLVERHTEGRLLGLFGEARVDVLQLNLALDRR